MYTCADPKSSNVCVCVCVGGGGGGPDNVFFFVKNVFHREPYGPPSRSNWTQGVQLLFEGCPYQNL